MKEQKAAPMKLLLKLLAAMLAGMIISYATLIDSIVKKLIEQEGSKALRAKVELQDAEFHLYPTSLTVRGLAATNPHEPMKNLLVAGDITGTLDLRALLANKIIFESITVNDLRLQQARKTSGAIEGITPAITSADSAQNSWLAAVDSQEIINRITRQLQDNLDNYKKQAVDIKTQWQQRREQFNTNKQLDTLKTRWRNLQNASTGEKLNGVRSLKKTVNAEFASSKKMADDLQIDLAVTQEIQQQAKSLVDRQINSALGNIDTALSSANENSLGEKLFANSVKTVINQLMLFYQTGNQNRTAGSANQPWPILIRQLSFSGQLDFGATALAVKGTINNANSSARQWQLPTSFSITSASKNNPGSLSIYGTFDHREPQQANDRIDFNLQDTAVTALPLSRASDVRVTLGQAIASMNGYLVLRNNQLDIMINNRFKQAQLIIETNVNGSSNGAAADNSLAATLAEALRGIDRFDLQINLSRALNSDMQTLRVSSSLDPLLANAATQFLKTSQDTLKPEIQAALQSHMEISLSELSKTRGELDAINIDISAYQQALKNLLATF
jgi:hypothetical protein